MLPRSLFIHLSSLKRIKAHWKRIKIFLGIYESTGTRTYGLGATFLCYCFELSRPDVSLGRCLSWAMSLFGDVLLWATSYFGRRLTLGDVLLWATSYLGDVLLWRRLTWAMSYFSSLGPLKGPTMCWLWLLVNARVRDGTIFIILLELERIRPRILNPCI